MLVVERDKNGKQFFIRVQKQNSKSIPQNSRINPSHYVLFMHLNKAFDTGIHSEVP